MNHKLILKCRALPLRPNEKAIIFVLATYANHETLTCFPSYKTIRNDTQATDSTIKRTIDLLSETGIIEYRNRADISTGKKNNEYRFVLNGIGIDFYYSKGAYKLSVSNRQILKNNIDKTRKKIIEARKSKSHKKKAISTTPPTWGKNTLPTWGNRKPQNSYLTVRNVAGLEWSTNTPPTTANTLPTWGRSNRDIVQISEATTSNNTEKQAYQAKDDTCQDSNIGTLNSKKTVLQERHVDSSLEDNQDSIIGSHNKQQKLRIIA